jgi:hypothetical protein
MDPETCIWLSRVGIVLGFLSFWCVLPEFLGDNYLKRSEQLLEASLKLIPIFIGVLVALSAIGAFAWYIAGGGIRVSDWWASLFGIDPKKGPIVARILLLIPLLGAAWLFSTIIVEWGFSAPRVAVDFGERWIDPILRRLANDERIRFRAFFVGASFFVLSFALQFAATFQAKEPKAAPAAPAVAAPATPTVTPAAPPPFIGPVLDRKPK